MTTIVRINPQPPAATVDNTMKEKSASLNNVKVTFAPVSSNVLTEIMGLVSIGLSKLGADSEATPILIYKWSTWLNRMNSWMKKNQAMYTKENVVPHVTLTGSLHFLGNYPPNDYATQMKNAGTTPLGPLLPGDINTLLNALRKSAGLCPGLEGSSENMFDEGRSLKIGNYINFIKDVNRIAVFAITENSSESFTQEIFTRSTVKGPIKHKANIMSVPLSPATGFTPFSSIAEHFEGNDDAEIEHFEGNNENGNGVTSKIFGIDLGFNLKKIPVWAWVLILMIIFYFFNKHSSSTNTLGTMFGGGCGCTEPEKILDISAFRQ